tara:strand:- start:397 stop:732 length:336 start_codon:yes stop_codon:yes gene_type:complete
MNKQLVNKINSREWVKCNEDARSAWWRQKFLSEHGGRFEKKHNVWIWRSINSNEGEDKKSYRFQDKEGNVYTVENMSKFCRDHDLNKSALYKVISGERNHHKGFIYSKESQ